MGTDNAKGKQDIHGTSKLIIALLLAADDIGYMPINFSHSKTRRGRCALKYLEPETRT